MLPHRYTTKRTTSWSCLFVWPASITLFLSITLVFFSTLITFDAKAQADSSLCSMVQFIFARGSGAPLGSDEFDQFDKQLRMRIDSRFVSISTYELGTGWPGHDNPDDLYPAVAVYGSKSANLTGLGAQMSDGESHHYGRSVDTGMIELLRFLNEHNERCPDTRYIIGGYSQGAHVVGDALPFLSPSVRNKIIFVALFGDPKLYLPEGEGVFPPACQGKEFSNWRRNVPVCGTDDGTLGARKPYIPQDMHGKVGTWCNEDDWMCGSSKNALRNSGHGLYHTIDGPIDYAAMEAAQKLTMTIPPPMWQHIKSGILLPSGHSPILNVSYIWHSSYSSRSLFDDTKAAIQTSAEQIWSQGGRAGITFYFEPLSAGGSWISPGTGNLTLRPPGETVGLYASDDRRDFYDRLNYFSGYPHGPTTGLRLLDATIETIDNLPWQLSAQKAMITIAEKVSVDTQTDYGLIRRTNAAGLFRPYITQRAIEIDPVNMYFITADPAYAEHIKYFTEATGGKVFTYNPEDPATLIEAMQSINMELTDRPIVIPSQTTYTGRNGEPIVIDASGSYATSGEIVRYDWDYDADGTWDHSSVQPHATHLYPDNFNGIAHIKATDSAGRIGTMTVNITMVPPSDTHALNIPFIEGMAYKIVETTGTTSSILLSWKTPGPAYNVMLNIDGRPTGYIEDRDQTSLIITDFRRDEDRTISLQAFDQHNNLGERRSVTIPAIPALSTDKGQALMSTRIGVNPLTPHPALLSHQSKPVSPSDNTPFNHSFGAAVPPAHTPPANDNNEKNTTTIILIAIVVAAVVFTAGGIAILRKKSSPYRHKNAK